MAIGDVGGSFTNFNLDRVFTDYLPLTNHLEPSGMTSLLIAAIVLRLILFAVAPSKSQGMKVGNWLLYAIAFLFIPYNLVFIILVLHLVMHTVFKNLNLSFLPQDENSAKDLFIFYIAVVASLAFSYFKNLSTLWDGIHFTSGPANMAIWSLGIIIFLAMNSKYGESEGSSNHTRASLVSLLLILIYFGSDAFSVYLVYLLIMPFLRKFKPLSSTTESFRRGTHKKATERGETDFSGETSPKVTAAIQGLGEKIDTMFGRVDQLESQVTNSQSSTRQAEGQIANDVQSKSATAFAKTEAASEKRMMAEEQSIAASTVGFLKNSIPSSSTVKKTLTIGKVFFIILLVAGLIFLFPVLFPNSSLTPALQASEEGAYKVYEGGVGVALDAKSSNPFVAAYQKWKTSFNQIGSDFDSAEIESSRGKQIGYKIDRRKTIQLGKIMTPLSVSYDIKGSTLNLETCKEKPEQDICYVGYRCEAEGGVASPEVSNVHVRDIENGGAVLTCTYTPYSSGNNDVKGIIDYGGRAKARVEAYFISQEEYDRAELEKDRDVAIKRYLQIPELHPVAISTDGPVTIGIGVSGTSKDKQRASSVVPIKEENGEYYIGYSNKDGKVVENGEDFGFTITKNWVEGKITTVSSVKISVPSFLKIDKCSPYTFSLSEENTQLGKNIYTLDRPIIEDIETGLPVDCKMYAETDPELRAGSTTVHIVVEVNYEYEQERLVRANIKPASEADVIIADDYTKSLDTCPTDVNSCEDYTQEFCSRDPCAKNCYWEIESEITLLPGTSWLGNDECQSCDSITSCEDYTNINLCYLDPCAKQCEWNKDLSTCRTFTTDLTLGSPTDKPEISVTKCESNELTIKAKKIVAVDSGKISLSGSSATLTIAGGYIVKYEGIMLPQRFNGNVVRGELIGVSDNQFKLTISKDGKSLSYKEIIDLYANKQRPRETSLIAWSRTRDSGCADEVTA